ncbi:MAG TPA: YciI family protein [Solirubrobacteraceae bacterium]
MPQYMMLLYAEQPADEAELQRRQGEFPRWLELNRNLQEAGVLVGGDQLAPVDVATTVRVREGESEIVDGPFATTKEILAGYYLLDCSDLDEALKWAARMPLAEWGSVEVRPLMGMSADEVSEPAAGAGQQAG